MVPPPSEPHDAIPAVELLVEALTGPGADISEDRFYSHLAEAVCRLADMRRALIFRYDEGSRRVRVAGAHGVDVGAFADAHISLEAAPLAATALAEDRVIEVRPPEPHQVAPAFAELTAGRPLIYVPIAAAGRWPGVILTEPQLDAPPLDEGRRKLLWTLGKTMALAAVARIATVQATRARQLEERIDLAREIHDRVVQRLFGVSLALSRPLDDGARVRAADEVQVALSDLRTALQRPLGRPARDTGTTLAEEVERLRAQVPEAHLELAAPTADVPPALEPLAQSVLVEAVRNAARHARPTRTAVRVLREDGVFALEVVNDGVDGERRRPASTGMGLRLAGLEAVHAGGVVEYGPREPGTWRVRLAVPLREP
ncbi:MAG TPA: GAF domain-containing protein [Baekduia sp.]|nr:GAF domain-containing protein [Baekduia sp.]